VLAASLGLLVSDEHNGLINLLPESLTKNLLEVQWKEKAKKGEETGKKGSVLPHRPFASPFLLALSAPVTEAPLGQLHGQAGVAAWAGQCGCMGRPVWLYEVPVVLCQGSFLIGDSAFRCSLSLWGPARSSQVLVDVKEDWASRLIR